MNTLRAAIFDCDGILIDSSKLQQDAEQQTALAFSELHGLPYHPESTDWQSMEGWARKKIASTIFGIPIDSEHADNFRLAVVEKTVEIANQENTPVVPGVTGFVETLATRGLMLGVATSSNRKIYQRYCEIQDLSVFPSHYVVTHGECKSDKPEPGQYQEVMDRMQVKPEETLVIEDSRSGITAGYAAGAFVLAVATTKSADYLQNHTDAHLVASNFDEALDLIEEHLPS